MIRPLCNKGLFCCISPCTTAEQVVMFTGKTAQTPGRTNHIEHEHDSAAV